MTPEGFQPERCAECSHPLGDHSVVKTGGLRPAAVGGCLLSSCDCTRYTPDTSTGGREDGTHGLEALAPGTAASSESGDAFIDAVRDARAEIAGDGEFLTMREAVNASLSAPHGCRDLYPHLRDRARHPYGLPAPDRARSLTGTPPTPCGGTTPTGLHPESPPAGMQAGGDHLPDAA